MADLPGSKIRIGELAVELFELVNGQTLTLTTGTVGRHGRQAECCLSRDSLGGWPGLF